MDLTENEIERFWTKVERGDPSTCWLWRGERLGPAASRGGRYSYGLFCIYRDGRRIRLRAHRLALESRIGPLADGLLACHSCDNPPCVNPDHLYAGTNQANLIEAAEKGGWQRGASIKIGPVEAREIRAIYAAGGVSQREVGRRFGISQMQVSRIVRGERWARA